MFVIYIICIHIYVLAYVHTLKHEFGILYFYRKDVDMYMYVCMCNLTLMPTTHYFFADYIWATIVYHRLHYTAQ